MANISKSVEQKMRNKAAMWKRKMGLKNRVNIRFEELPTDVDAKTVPYYYQGANGKPRDVTFDVTFNTAFINANKNNIESDGVVGAIIHEFVHCLHFLVNMQEYNTKPHTCKFFRENLKKYMKIAGDGIHDYKDGYRPDIRIAAAVRKRRNSVAPSWLDRYWIYCCKDCGFVNTFISDLKSPQPPKCEKCGSTNLIRIKVPVVKAAQYEMSSNTKLKNICGASARDKEIVKFLIDYLRKNLRGRNLDEFKKVIAAKYKNGKYITKPSGVCVSSGVIRAKSTLRKGKRERIDVMVMNRG